MAGRRIKKNDTVKIIAGKNKGETGKVQAVDVAKGRVIVEGINLVKKTMKRKSQQEQGGVIEIEAFMDISNVQIISKGGISRVGYDVSGDKKIRIAKKTGEAL